MYPSATQTPIYRRSRRVATYPTFTNSGTETRGVLVVELRIDRETFPEGLDAWRPDTTSHTPALDYLDVGLVGHMRHGRVDDGGGQCEHVLTDEGTRPVEAYTTEDLARLAELWERWHSCAMRAGCAHQPSYTEAAAQAERAGILDTYGRPDAYAWQRQRGACPQGYEYGSAWLVEPVPPEAVAALVDLLEQDPETVEHAGAYAGPGPARHAVETARELYRPSVTA